MFAELYLYGKIGFDHIIDWRAFDHILFLLALTAPVNLSRISRLWWLITAFTIGHSITLACSIYKWIHIPSAWIECLIPLTIVIAASLNLWNSQKPNLQQGLLGYLLILLFGFIHGMGFADDLTHMLAEGDSVSIPLISMNVGLEIGQLLIVCCIIFLNMFGQKYLGLNDHSRNRILSLCALVLGLYFTILHLPFNG